MATPDKIKEFHEILNNSDEFKGIYKDENQLRGILSDDTKSQEFFNILQESKEFKGVFSDRDHLLESTGIEKKNPLQKESGKPTSGQSVLQSTSTSTKPKTWNQVDLPNSGIPDPSPLKQKVVKSLNDFNDKYGTVYTEEEIQGKETTPEQKAGQILRQAAKKQADGQAVPKLADVLAKKGERNLQYIEASKVGEDEVQSMVKTELEAFQKSPEYQQKLQLKQQEASAALEQKKVELQGAVSQGKITADLANAELQTMNQNITKKINDEMGLDWKNHFETKVKPTLNSSIAAETEKRFFKEVAKNQVLSKRAKWTIENIANKDEFRELSFPEKKKVIASTWELTKSALKKKGYKEDFIQRYKEEFMGEFVTQASNKKGQPTSYAIREWSETALKEIDERRKEILSSPEYSEVRMATTGPMGQNKQSFTDAIAGKRSEPSQKGADIYDELVDLDMSEQNIKKMLELPESQQGTLLQGVGYGIGQDKNLPIPMITTALNLSNSLNIYKAAKKAKEGKALTEGEKFLLHATGMETAYNQDVEPSFGFTAGRKATVSLPFAADMALGNWASAPARTAVKEGMSKLAPKLAESVIYKQGVARPISVIIGEMARTAADPAKWANSFVEHMSPEIRFALGEESGDKATGYNPTNVKIDDMVAVLDSRKTDAITGAKTGKGMDPMEAFAYGFLDNFKENLTEQLGGAFDGVGSKMIQSLAKNNEWAKRLYIGYMLKMNGGMTPGSFAKTMAQLRKGISEQAGINGFLGENLEEYGAAIAEDFMYNRKLGQSFTPEFFKETAAVTGLIQLPMYALGLGAKGIDRIVNNNQRKSKLYMRDMNDNIIPVNIPIGPLAMAARAVRMGKVAAVDYLNSELGKTPLSPEQRLAVSQYVQSQMYWNEIGTQSNEMFGVSYDALRSADKRQAVRDKAFSALQPFLKTKDQQLLDQLIKKQRDAIPVEDAEIIDEEGNPINQPQEEPVTEPTSETAPNTEQPQDVPGSQEPIQPPVVNGQLQLPPMTTEEEEVFDKNEERLYSILDNIVNGLPLTKEDHDVIQGNLEWFDSKEIEVPEYIAPEDQEAYNSLSDLEKQAFSNTDEAGKQEILAQAKAKLNPEPEVIAAAPKRLLEQEYPESTREFMNSLRDEFFSSKKIGEADYNDLSDEEKDKMDKAFSKFIDKKMELEVEKEEEEVETKTKTKIDFEPRNETDNLAQDLLGERIALDSLIEIVGKKMIEIGKKGNPYAINWGKKDSRRQISDIAYDLLNNPKSIFYKENFDTGDALELVDAIADFIVDNPGGVRAYINQRKIEIEEENQRIKEEFGDIDFSKIDAFVSALTEEEAERVYEGLTAVYGDDLERLREDLEQWENDQDPFSSLGLLFNNYLPGVDIGAAFKGVREIYDKEKANRQGKAAQPPKKGDGKQGDGKQPSKKPKSAPKIGKSIDIDLDTEDLDFLQEMDLFGGSEPRKSKSDFRKDYESMFKAAQKELREADADLRAIRARAKQQGIEGKTLDQILRPKVVRYEQALIQFELIRKQEKNVRSGEDSQQTLFDAAPKMVQKVYDKKLTEEQINKGGQILDKFFERGVYDFATIAGTIQEKINDEEKFENILASLVALYGQKYTQVEDDIADQMDDRKGVRKVVQDYFTAKEEDVPLTDEVNNTEEIDSQGQKGSENKDNEVATKEEFEDAALKLTTLDLEDDQVVYPNLNGKKLTDIGGGKDYNLSLIEREALPESGPFEISIENNEGEEIGFIRGSKSNNTISFNLIHIKQDYRGKGIGTDIYEKFLNDGYTVKSDKEITDSTYSLYTNLANTNNYDRIVFSDGRVGLVKPKNQKINVDSLPWREAYDLLNTNTEGRYFLAINDAISISERYEELKNKTNREFADKYYKDLPFPYRALQMTISNKKDFAAKLKDEVQKNIVDKVELSSKIKGPTEEEIAAEIERMNQSQDKVKQDIEAARIRLETSRRLQEEFAPFADYIKNRYGLVFDFDSLGTYLNPESGNLTTRQLEDAAKLTFAANNIILSNNSTKVKKIDWGVGILKENDFDPSKVVDSMGNTQADLFQRNTLDGFAREYKSILDQSYYEPAKWANDNNNAIQVKVINSSAASSRIMKPDGTLKDINRADLFDTKEELEALLPEKKEYRYQLTQRPLGIGTYPNTPTLIRLEDGEPGNRRNYGYAVYSERLSPEKWRSYELLPIDEVEEIEASTYRSEYYNKITAKRYSGNPNVLEVTLDEPVNETEDFEPDVISLTVSDFYKNLEDKYFIKNDTKNNEPAGELPVEDQMGPEDVSPSTGGNQPGGGQNVEGNDGQGNPLPGDNSGNGNVPPTSGIPGDTDVFGGQPGDGGLSTSGGNRGGGAGSGSTGRSSNGGTPTDVQGNNRNPIGEGTNLSFDQKLWLQKESEGEPVNYGVENGEYNAEAHRQNVNDNLPAALDSQQEDITKAEKSLFVDNKKAVLFTNGTGTGKTSTAVGLVKRAVKKGQRVLIITPKQPINDNFINEGKWFQLDVYRLDSKTDIGYGPDMTNGPVTPKVIVTTFSNFGDNLDIQRENFDLIIVDEADQIMSSLGGNDTLASDGLRVVANHRTEAKEKSYEAIIGPKYSELRDEEFRIRKEISSLQRMLTKLEGLEEDRRKLNVNIYGTVTVEDLMAVDSKIANMPTKGEMEAKIAEFQTRLYEVRSEKYDLVEKTNISKEFLENEIQLQRMKKRVVFMSATPFASVKATDYAEDFLFQYPKDQYGQPDFNQFIIDRFGYRIRNSKLTAPDAGVNVGALERQFHEDLKADGVLFSRQLASEYDYSRDFLRLNDPSGEQGIGKMLDQGIALMSSDQYKLAPIVNYKMDYLYKTRLLEAYKAKIMIPQIKEAIDRGYKVVIFHNYNQGAPSHPFVYTDAELMNAAKGDQGQYQFYKNQLAKFEADHPEFMELDMSGLINPGETIQRAFPEETVLYRGGITNKKKQEFLRAFNQGSKKIFVGNKEASKAGISLHDTTGEFPRILFNIGMPIKSNDVIQTEGRPYRVGNMSDAAFLYPVTHTNFELSIFSSKTAPRTATAENFALGNQARDLYTRILEGYLDASDEIRWDELGKGGKAADRTIDVSPFDLSINHYNMRGKRDRNSPFEGVDFFPTPEPLGFKMVEWLHIRAGMKVLEPSVGKGSIARYFPDYANPTIVEMHEKNLLTAAMFVQNKSDLTSVVGKFEDLHSVNKYDRIAMNPPFGTAGKMAVDHILKAFNVHLRDYGRLIAIMPTSPRAIDRMNNFLYGEEANQEAVLRAVYSLPDVTFSKAGTKVNCFVIVIDKFKDEEVRNQVKAMGGSNFNAPNTMLKNVGSINEMFEQLRDMDGPSIIEPKEVPETDSPQTAPTVEPDLKAEVVKNYHDKKKRDNWVVTLNKRTDALTYQTLNSRAKQTGQGYSSFKGKGAIPGFQFDKESAANDFAAWVNSGNGEEPKLMAEKGIVDYELTPNEVAFRDTLTDVLADNFKDIADEVIVSPSEDWKLPIDSNTFKIGGEGQIMGAFYGNKVFIDPRVARPQTPIHEFGHAFIKALKTKSPEIVSRGFELMNGTDYLADVQSSPAYRNDTLESQQEEALVRAISDRGVQILDPKKKSSFLQWLRDFWNEIKSMVGFTGVTPKQLSEMTLDEYLNKAVGTMFNKSELDNVMMEGQYTPYEVAKYELMKAWRDQDMPLGITPQAPKDPLGINLFAKAVKFAYQAIKLGAKNVGQMLKGTGFKISDYWRKVFEAASKPRTESSERATTLDFLSNEDTSGLIYLMNQLRMMNPKNKEDLVASLDALKSISNIIPDNVITAIDSLKMMAETHDFPIVKDFIDNLSEEAAPKLALDRNGNLELVFNEKRQQLDIDKAFALAQEVKQVLNDLGIKVSEKRKIRGALGRFFTLSKKVEVLSLMEMYTAIHEAMHFVDDKHGLYDKVMATRGSNPVKADLEKIYLDYYAGAKAEHPTKLKMIEGMAVLMNEYLYDPVKTKLDYPHAVNAFLTPGGIYNNPDINTLMDRMQDILGKVRRLNLPLRLQLRMANWKAIIKEPGFLSQYTWKNVSPAHVGMWRWLKFQKNQTAFTKELDNLAGISYQDTSTDVAFFHAMRANSISSAWLNGDQPAAIYQKGGKYKFSKANVAEIGRLVEVAGKAAGLDKEDAYRAFESYLIARRMQADFNRMVDAKNTLDAYIASIGDEDPTPIQIAIMARLYAQYEAYKSIVDNDQQDIAAIQATIQVYADTFELATNMFTEVNRNLLEFSRNTGLISEDNYAEWVKNDDYASFQRVIFDDIANQGPSQSSGGASVSKPSQFKTRKGNATRTFMGPYTAMIMQVPQTINRGYQNLWWQNFGNYVKRFGKQVSISKKETQAGTKEDVKLEFDFMYLPKQGRMIDGKPDLSHLERMVANGEAISFFINGKKVYYKTAPWIQAMASTMIPEVNAEFLENVMKMGADVFAQMTTSASIPFALQNLAVDQISTLFTTKTGKVTPIVDEVYEFAKEYKAILRVLAKTVGIDNLDEKDMARLEKFLALGGSRLTLYSSFENQTIGDIISKVRPDMNAKIAAKKIGGKIMDTLSIPVNSTEIATRFGEFSRALNQGDSEDLAMYKAAQVSIPWHEKGLYGGKIGRTSVRSVAYAAASIRAAEKMVKSAIENPTRAAIVGGILTAASVATMAYGFMAASDDDRAAILSVNAEEFGKYVFYYDGEEWGRIRMPEPFSSIFGTAQMLALSYVNYHWRQKPSSYTAEEWFRPTLGSLPFGEKQVAGLTEAAVKRDFDVLLKTGYETTPTLLQASFMAGTGKKFFPTVMPIVPQYLADKPVEQQFNKRTSEFSKFVGQKLGVSPMVSDAFLAQQFGSNARFLLQSFSDDPKPFLKAPWKYGNEKAWLRGREYNQFMENLTAFNQEKNGLLGKMEMAYGLDKSEMQAIFNERKVTPSDFKDRADIIELRKANPEAAKYVEEFYKQYFVAQAVNEITRETAKLNELTDDISADYKLSFFDMLYDFNNSPSIDPQVAANIKRTGEDLADKLQDKIDEIGKPYYNELQLMDKNPQAKYLYLELKESKRNLNKALKKIQ
jgi:hypothetical protein